MGVVDGLDDDAEDDEGRGVEEMVVLVGTTVAVEDEDINEDTVVVVVDGLFKNTGIPIGAFGIGVIGILEEVDILSLVGVKLLVVVVFVLFVFVLVLLLEGKDKVVDGKVAGVPDVTTATRWARDDTGIVLSFDEESMVN